MEMFQRVRAVHQAVRLAIAERDHCIEELTKQRNDISAERAMMEKSALDLARDLELAVTTPADITEEDNDGS